MCDWLCYLLYSLDSGRTYIGSTNNIQRRLKDHNNNDPKIKRKGARCTAGQVWVPVLYITGFETKNLCLSFESGWKKISRKRSKVKANPDIVLNGYSYSNNNTHNRVVDLFFFINNVTELNNKYIFNHNLNYPVFIVSPLTVNIMIEESIKNFRWPSFVQCRMFNVG